MKFIRIKWMSDFFMVIFLMSVLSIQGCGSMRSRYAVPIDFLEKVTIPGMPDIRSDINDPDPIVMQKSLMDSFKEEGKNDYPANELGIKIYPMLVVSAGGLKGAYGAGFLKGWSQEGSRPIFKIITGVSSGSIIALCAFLGKDYDDKLEKFFTTLSTKDIMKRNNVFSILFGKSFMSSSPLAKKISVIVDEKFMARVAEEHRRGRRLFIGTVNLDAEEFIVWDMGAVACKGGPDSVQMFRKILLASSSMPMMFPPVYFKVSSVSGELYDEMHVDGGAMRELFFVDQLTKNIDFSKYRPQIYILSTSHMSPNRQQVRDNLIDIGTRALEMLEAQAYSGDIYRLFAFVQKRSLDFNLAYIPADFKLHPKELFDIKEMQRLFKRGYDDAVNGYKWHKTPPGYAAEDER